MSNLFIVSNRGPFSFSDKLLRQAEADIKQGRPPTPPDFGGGGLVQAMTGLLKEGQWNSTWIGASMGNRDIDVARGHYKWLFDEIAKQGWSSDKFPHIEIEPDTRMHFRFGPYEFYLRFVFFDTHHMHSYYNRFSNGFLWPLMHLTREPLFYKKDMTYPRPYFEKNDFIQYTSSGVTFANTIVDEIQKSGEFWKKKNDIVIWTHDYHLMRIAETYRALLLEQGLSENQRKKINIGQFMHTPFFNIHEIQGLIREDKRKRLKRHVFDPFMETIETALQKLTWGLLANDFVGFHTKEYCDNYLEALEEWFPVNIDVNGDCYEITSTDRVTTVGAIPIGVDVDRILSEVAEDRTLEHRVEGKDLYHMIQEDRNQGKLIFGGLERRDYTKGLIERCRIFAYILKRLRYQDKDARFYQATSPSRFENPSYRYLSRALDREIEKTNKELGGEPIVHIHEGIPVPQNYRFLKQVEVMLVTPLEDGMNLVAFEYLLSQKHLPPERRGLLVLGTSGASRVLREKGFGPEQGLVTVNPMKPSESGDQVLAAIRSGCRISEELIAYIEKEKKVKDWARKNVGGILECRKRP